MAARARGATGDLDPHYVEALIEEDGHSAKQRARPERGRRQLTMDYESDCGEERPSDASKNQQKEQRVGIDNAKLRNYAAGAPDHI